MRRKLQSWRVKEPIIAVKNGKECEYENIYAFALSVGVSKRSAFDVVNPKKPFTHTIHGYEIRYKDNVYNVDPFND